ncbi:aromatic amino acid aminotransferase [Metschnikowia bicuspidata var. bicuspidata NRRL YB-4993]|uniref:aromatic-amino-acid transaminase n=1 Tax=Metschnikowia bicuspidata var. bicuspidata NRRL YB-4993 TaxID=869754 RepID=A0A1A0HJE0_9ASCO|nr:aromatic amino acid aminotransferase [Metschnikowia bicuspidata var. bicuspidata NRRL YB-4993]OBA24130.1 aromatic amino acid aminotransferase [Metschnikowia bicuspidata var. bicuspidata NRRL YB-4993]
MTKPFAKDMSHHLSAESKSRKELNLKNAFKYFNQPGMTFLGGGLPLSDYFPFEKITADVPLAPFPNGCGARVTEQDKTVVEVHKRKADNDPAAKDVELARSLQYGYTEGHTELVDFLKEHTDRIHRVPYEDWDVVTNVGNTQAWDACLRNFTTKGDVILVEDHTFSSAIEAAYAQGVTTFPITMDTEGIVPEALEQLMDNWVGAKPRMLYTICTGQNPTGSCLSAERRRAVYAVAQKHDLLIVEDEPYYFLQMEPYTKDVEARASRHVHGHDDFVRAMVPSFLSMDVDGRVLRLDSVLKTIAPGARLGWVVGQKKLLERFVRLHELTIQNTSGFTQSLLNGLFQRWGQGGYLDWLIGIRGEYTHKRDVAIDALYKYFPQEVVTILPPVAGMFFVVHLDASKHPRFAELGSDPVAVETSIYEAALEHGCLMIPGSWFKAEGQTTPPQPSVSTDELLKNSIFFRGTYAAVPLDQLVIGLEKFGKAVKAEYNL